MNSNRQYIPTTSSTVASPSFFNLRVALPPSFSTACSSLPVSPSSMEAVVGFFPDPRGAIPSGERGQILITTHHTQCRVHNTHEVFVCLYKWSLLHNLETDIFSLKLCMFQIIDCFLQNFGNLFFLKL